MSDAGSFRLQNSRFLFIKKIGLAWPKSLTRAKGRVRREKRNHPLVLASPPSLALRFPPRSRPFVLLFVRTGINKSTDFLQSMDR